MALDTRERPDVPPAHGTTLVDPVSPPVSLRSPLWFVPARGRAATVRDWLGVVVGVYLLITAVSVIGSGFKMATGDQAAELFAFATNPMVALVIGLLATVATQSSTTTTAIVVGLAAGGLPMQIAIPMLLGANLGTTMTNSLVSFGMVRDKEVFRRAFGAATVHDFFNLIAVAMLLPLELATGFLEKLSGAASGALAGSDGGILATVFGGLGAAVTGVTKPLASFAVGLVEPLPAVAAGLVLVALGVALILLVINGIGMLLKVLLVGRAKEILHSAIGRGPMSGIASGTLVTMMVQSSTTTTSLAVPLAGSGALSVKQIYPFTIGANIGTTFTALIASFAFTGVEGELALQAALVHVFFNLAAATIIYGIPFLRPLPVVASLWLAKHVAERKSFGVLWVTGVFVVLPLILIALSAWLS